MYFLYISDKIGLYIFLYLIIRLSFIQGLNTEFP